MPIANSSHDSPSASKENGFLFNTYYRHCSLVRPASSPGRGCDGWVGLLRVGGGTTTPWTSVVLQGSTCRGGIESKIKDLHTVG